MVRARVSRVESQMCNSVPAPDKHAGALSPENALGRHRGDPPLFPQRAPVGRMSDSARRGRIHTWSSQAARRGLHAGHLLVRAASLLIALLMAKRTALHAVTPARGRKALKALRLPAAPLHLDEVQVGNTTLQLYWDGHTLYEAMLAAIDGAGESIYLQASTWKDDEVGRAFKRHLAQKAADGVVVYIMCAGLGKSSGPRAFRSSPAGMHILGRRAFRRAWQALDPRRYA